MLKLLLPFYHSLFFCQEHCATTQTFCHDVCPVVLGVVQQADPSNDGWLDEEEFLQAGIISGLPHLFPEGIYECFYALRGNSGCLQDVSPENMQLDYGRAAALGLWLFGYPATTCSGCL